LATKTIYICDVCEDEMSKVDKHQVAMAVHKDNDTPISVRLDVCENCLRETGFDPNHGNSTNNHDSVKRRPSVWFKWFKKGK